MSRNYMFTIFTGANDRYELETDIFDAEALKFVKYAIWQLEKCPDTDRLHLQGYAEFSKVFTLPGAKKVFHPLYRRTVHLEKRRGTADDACRYCSKEDSRVQGPFAYGQRAVRGQRSDLSDVLGAINRGADYEEICLTFPDQAAKYNAWIQSRIEKHRSSQLLPPDITLRSWQVQLRDQLLGTPHPREILWYWDPIGNTGKTTFAMWLLRSYPTKVQLFLGGRSADVAFALDSSKSIFVFDYSRDSAEYLNWGTLEAIKNGIVWSGKWASMLKQFATPHVLIFSNQPPDRTKMSADRWNVTQIVTLRDAS